MRESMPVGFSAEGFDFVFVGSSMTKEWDSSMSVLDRAAFAASLMPSHAGVYCHGGRAHQTRIMSGSSQIGRLASTALTVAFLVDLQC